MRFIAKVIRISRAKCDCDRLTTVQDIQHYMSRIFWHTVYNVKCCLRHNNAHIKGQMSRSRDLVTVTLDL